MKCVKIQEKTLGKCLRPRASHETPLGRIAFSDWLSASATSVGRSYANELQRHFARMAAAV